MIYPCCCCGCGCGCGGGGGGDGDGGECVMYGICVCRLLVGGWLLGIWYGAKGYYEESYLFILWVWCNIACLFLGNWFFCCVLLCPGVFCASMLVWWLAW